MGQPQDLIQIFIEEGREIIDLLDQNIVLLEKSPSNKALLDDVFRALSFHRLFLLSLYMASRF